MQRIFGFITLFTLTLFFAVTANRAVADSVHLTFDGAFGDAVTVSGENTLAGPYKFTIGNPNTSSIPNNDYYGFCIQFNQNIFNGQQGDFTVETLKADLGQTKADQILRLIYDYSTTVINSPNPGDLGDPSNPAHYNFGSDALTIAIWDVLQATGNDGDGNLSIGGTNQISASNWGDATRGAAAVTQANAWLKDLQYNVDPTTNLYDSTKVVAFYNESIQDQSIVLGFTPFVTTPEPTSRVGLAGMCMLGLMIGGTFAYGRRRAA
jgi:hypothetical protein